MYGCKSCGYMFDEPDEGKEFEYLDGWRFVSQAYFKCPICGSDHVEELKKCPFCGELVMHLTEADCCESCANTIRAKLNELLHKAFTEREIDALNELYDGERLG